MSENQYIQYMFESDSMSVVPSITCKAKTNTEIALTSCARPTWPEQTEKLLRSYFYVTSFEFPGGQNTPKAPIGGSHAHAFVGETRTIPSDVFSFACGS